MKAPKRSHNDALVRRLISGAYLDPLTNLFNRTSFAEAVAVGVTRAAAAGRLAAVLHLDIDGFSGVNQALGTGAGDRLLVEFGDRLRQTALPADLLARGGGDDFFVFLGDAAELGELQRRIERFLKTLRRPVLFDGHELSVSVSLGSAVFPEDGVLADALINAAGTALDVCRRLGAGHEVTTESDGDAALARAEAAPVDLVITDIVMPGREGKLILEIRRRFATLPVIAVSGGQLRGGQDILDMAHRLGAIRTLAKPFRPRQLVDMVETCHA